MVDCLHQVSCSLGRCWRRVVEHRRWRWSLLSLKRAVDGLSDHVDEHSLLVEETVLTLLLLLLLVSLALFRSVVLSGWRYSWCWYHDWSWSCDRSWSWDGHWGCYNGNRDCSNCWGCWSCIGRWLGLVATHELQRAVLIECLQVGHNALMG